MISYIRICLDGKSCQQCIKLFCMILGFFQVSQQKILQTDCIKLVCMMFHFLQIHFQRKHVPTRCFIFIANLPKQKIRQTHFIKQPRIFRLPNYLNGNLCRHAASNNFALSIFLPMYIQTKIGSNIPCFSSNCLVLNLVDFFFPPTLSKHLFGNQFGVYQGRIRGVSGPYQGRIRGVSGPYQGRIRQYLSRIRLKIYFSENLIYFFTVGHCFT